MAVEPGNTGNLVDKTLEEAKQLRTTGAKLEARQLLQRTLFLLKPNDLESIGRVLTYLIDIETEGLDNDKKIPSGANLNQPPQPTFNPQEVKEKILKLRQIAQTAKDMGEKEEARRCYLQASKLIDALQASALFHAGPNPKDKASSDKSATKDSFLLLRRMAQMAKNIGKKEEARRCYLQAIKIVDALDDLESHASLLKAYAILEEDMGHYEIALKLYQESAEIYERINNPVSQGKVLQAKATLLQNLERKDESRAVWQQAAVLCGEGKDPQDEASLQIGLGNLMMQLQNWDSARSAYEVAWLLSAKANSLKEESHSVKGLIKAIEYDYPEKAKILRGYYSYLMDDAVKDPEDWGVHREQALVTIKI